MQKLQAISTENRNMIHLPQSPLPPHSDYKRLSTLVGIHTEQRQFCLRTFSGHSGPPHSTEQRACANRFLPLVEGWNSHCVSHGLGEFAKAVPLRFDRFTKPSVRDSSSIAPTLLVIKPSQSFKSTSVATAPHPALKPRPL